VRKLSYADLPLYVPDGGTVVNAAESIFEGKDLRSAVALSTWCQFEDFVASSRLVMFVERSPANVVVFERMVPVADLDWLDEVVVTPAVRRRFTRAPDSSSEV